MARSRPRAATRGTARFYRGFRRSRPAPPDLRRRWHSGPGVAPGPDAVSDPHRLAGTLV